MLELPEKQKKIMRRRRLGAPPSTIIVPPFDVAHNVWAFDPDGIAAAQFVAGPTGTITTPTKTQGTPSFYTFGASDTITFGDALDTTWTTATGFTLYFCLKPSSGDLAQANAPVWSKALETELILNASQADFYTYYAGGATNYTRYSWPVGQFVAGNKYVVAITFDATQARASRVVMYKNASVTGVGVTPANVGTDGTIADTAAVMVLGNRSGLTNPITVSSYAYAYNTVHSAGTVASITSWLQTTKGWV